MNASTSSTRSIKLTGVDGTNPLGFLAALGTLVVAGAAGESAARLRWTRSRTWTPALDDLKSTDREQFCEALAVGLRGRVVSPEVDEKRHEADEARKQARTAVTNEMKKIKTEKLRGEDRKKAIEERVRPLETVADKRRSEWLATLKDAVPRPELAIGGRIDCTGAEYRDHAVEFTDADDRTSREAIQYLAAFGTDACLDDTKGDLHQRTIEATPFCFIRGSGHQDFLEFVRQLLENVTPERVSEALFEPWVYRDEGLSMRWDPGEDRRYALMDRDPTASDNKARTVWMANLLAYRSLALFPCAPTQRGLGATAWTTIQGEKAFTWPLWEFAATPDTVRTLLQLEGLRRERLDRSVLDARGIAATFRARRIRFPPTGSSYKLNFSPARVV